jgi:hypothetical protein
MKKTRDWIRTHVGICKMNLPCTWDWCHPSKKELNKWELRKERKPSQEESFWKKRKCQVATFPEPQGKLHEFESTTARQGLPSYTLLRGIQQIAKTDKTTTWLLTPWPRRKEALKFLGRLLNPLMRLPTPKSCWSEEVVADESDADDIDELSQALKD